MPERRADRAPKLPELPTRPFEALSKGSGKLEVATTMALVRLIKDLMKDKQVGKYFVPIIPDEARTSAWTRSSRRRRSSTRPASLTRPSTRT